MINPLKLITFWVLLALILIFIIIPNFGPSILALYSYGFMAVFLGPIGMGLLPNLITVALILDILRRKIPLILLSLPLFLYGYYYVHYYEQKQLTLDVQARLKADNKTKIMQFDPQTHDLVMRGAAGFVGNYKIPVAYSRKDGGSNEFISHRLLSYDDCKRIVGESKRLAYCKIVRWPQEERFTGGIKWSVVSFEFPQNPDKEIVEIVVNVPPEQEGLFLRPDYKVFVGKFDTIKPAITTYTFYLDDKIIGNFKTAQEFSYYPMPAIQVMCPFFEKKRKSITEASKCVKPLRIMKALNTYSDIPLDANSRNPVGKMLGIPRYSQREIESFSSRMEDLEKLKSFLKNKELEVVNRYKADVGEYEGYPSFRGVIGSRDKGLLFRNFIEQHSGKVVYLDITAEANPNFNNFTNYGVCRPEEKQCSGRTDNTYEFQTEDGQLHQSEGKGRFKGVYLVGTQVLLESSGADRDTRTVLTLVSSASSSVDSNK